MAYVETKKFSIAAPPQTHSRPASCQEVDCPDYKHGWKIRIEGLPPHLYRYVTNAGRKFRRLQTGPGETWLIYGAEQPCFEKHYVSLGRQEFYVVRDTNGSARKHTKPEFWVEEHSEDLEKLRKKIEE